MIQSDSIRQTPSAMIVVDAGNSAVKLGLWNHAEILTSETVSYDRIADLAGAFRTLAHGIEPESLATIPIASVVPGMSDVIASAVQTLGASLAFVGRDIPLPIPLDVEHPTKIGVDRICGAAAAHARTHHACTIVSLGTAITVDLVSDNGVFLGGAILPGLGLQMRALAEHTEQLPSVEPVTPERAIGKSTEAAIQSGVGFGTVGAIRALVERYASELGTWPQVVVTGGDVPYLAAHLDFADSLVPELGLMGVGIAWDRAHPSPAE